MRFHYFLVLFGFLAAPFSLVRGDVIASNLNTEGTTLYGQSSLPFPNYFVANDPVSATNFDIGVAFTPTANFSLAQIDLPIQFECHTAGQVPSCFGGNSAGGSLGLYTDSGGMPSATPITTWTLQDDVDLVDTCCVLDTQLFSGIELTAGQKYWIVAIPQDNAVNVWQPNVLGQSGDWASGVGYAPGYGYPDTSVTWTAQTGPAPAFDVLGTRLPEPSSTSSLLIALIGAFCLARERRCRR